MRAFRTVMSSYGLSSGGGNSQSRIRNGVYKVAPLRRGQRHFVSQADSSPRTASASSTTEVLTPKPGLTCMVPPTRAQLRRLAGARGIPYVGFGFLDNFLMILAGDFIDGTMCVYFSFSTMAAAALGNTISDVAGVFSGGVIEDYARNRGFEVPPLSDEQKDLWITKAHSYGGQSVGIIVGCLLGMMPLLWIDPEEANREKKKKQREAVFATVLQEVKDILRAEASVLMFLDPEKDILHTAATGSLPAFTSKTTEGIMGYVIKSGKYVNIQDVRLTQWFDQNRHEDYQGTGINVRSVLCMPVYGDMYEKDEGKKKMHDKQWMQKKYAPIGVIEVINKKTGIFTRKDEDVLAAICSHVSVALSDEETSFKKVIDMCQTQMKQRAGLHVEMTAMQRNEMLFKQILDELNSLVGTERAGLYIIGEANDSLALAAQSTGSDVELCSKVMEGLLGHAAKTGRMIKVDDVANSSSLRENEGLILNQAGIRGFVALPIFDNETKVIGLLQCVNKKNNSAFNSDDVELLSVIGSHFALTLEGEGSSMKKIIRIVAAQQRKRGTSTNGTSPVKMDLDRLNVVCFAHTAQGLPGSKIAGRPIDPYLTMQIVHGDPFSPNFSLKVAAESDVPDAAQRTTVKNGGSPLWNEHLYLDIPSDVKNHSIHEYYVHVKLWDYDYKKENELVGQMVYPLSRIITTEEDTLETRSFPILPMKGKESRYELSNARLNISFRTEQKDEQQRVMNDRRNSTVLRFISWKSRRAPSTKT
eukprot:GEMP01003518.1.p1 GENE.GEMP01003518.1~~GEMP01003518.1.p1  ORF type:complete len:768 (+),score=126.45 GEMP01003518.1:36-2306(+)